MEMDSPALGALIIFTMPIPTYSRILIPVSIVKTRKPYTINMKKRITCFLCYLSPVAATGSLCVCTRRKNIYQEHAEIQKKKKNTHRRSRKNYK